MKKPAKRSSVRYAKPLSKEESRLIKEHHLPEDEYRYQQACSWAILMGEQLPDRKRFMADLAKKREATRKAAMASGFVPSNSKGRRR